MKSSKLLLDHLRNAPGEDYTEMSCCECNTMQKKSDSNEKYSSSALSLSHIRQIESRTKLQGGMIPFFDLKNLLQNGGHM